MLVIEGWSNSQGDYTVDMNCPTIDGTIECGQTVTGTTSGEDNTHGNAAPDHFYSFTVTEPQVYQFDSCDSSYDTYLRVYALDLDEQIQGCDDCGDCGLQTVLDTILLAGDYVLVIEGFSSSEGEYAVTMNCVGPQAGGFLDGDIACGETVTGSTVAAGSHVGGGSSDHIYSFILPPSSQQVVQFDSCDSAFDTFLRVTGEDIRGGDLAACDDCGPCGLQTVLDAPLTCDENDDCTFHLVIEGFSTNEGEYSVTMNCAGMENDGTIACGQTVRGNTAGAESAVGNAGVK